MEEKKQTVCTIKQKFLCKNYDSCEICLERRFNENESSAKLVDKTLNHKLLFKKTTIKYEFCCEICEHIFIASMCSVSRGKGCKYCSIPSFILCLDQNCIFCLNRSFKSHEKSIFWDIEKNNGVMPRDVFKASNKKFFFICKQTHSFEMRLACIKKGRFCPKCAFKTELKLYNWLLTKFEEENIKRQFIFKDTKFRYDFLLIHLAIIIEIDGPQHIKNTPFFKTKAEDVILNDTNKIKLCIENNYTIIHIFQPDVLKDSNDWEEKLLSAIKPYKTPKIIFINDSKNTYENHINEFKDNTNLIII